MNPAVVHRATHELKPIAWRLLIGLALVKLAVHLLAAGPLAWGYMTDELYYLDSIDRLDWGFVDHPPLCVALLGLVRAGLGSSIFAIRLVPALLAAATVALTGLIARELGGGRVAQGLAAVAALTSPVHLSMAMFYSMNPIDDALWPLATLLLLRLINGGTARLWLLIGAVIGIGLLNKASMSWFATGLGVGLLLTPERRWLKTPWPWAAAAIAAVCFAPFVWWQIQNGWPFIEFSRNAALYKVGHVSPLAFLRDQILAANLMTAPLWIAGMVWAFAPGALRPYRAVVWIFVTVFLMLAFSGSARPHYLAPALPIAFAVGGMAAERCARRRPWLPRAATIAVVIGGVGSAPLAMPLLPPAATGRYQDLLGLRPREELERGGLLPMHLGLFFHAEAVLKPLLEVYASLSPEERAHVEILTGSFGESGAVDVLGTARGLPRSIGRQNQYWLWGPGNATGELMIVVHDSEADLREWFTRCEPKARIDCPYCMDLLQRNTVFLCHHARRPLPELWPQMKLYR